MFYMPENAAMIDRQYLANQGQSARNGLLRWPRGCYRLLQLEPGDWPPSVPTSFDTESTGRSSNIRLRWDRDDWQAAGAESESCNLPYSAQIQCDGSAHARCGPQYDCDVWPVGSSCDRSRGGIRQPSFDTHRGYGTGEAPEGENSARPRKAMRATDSAARKTVADSDHRQVVMEDRLTSARRCSATQHECLQPMTARLRVSY